MSSENSGWNHSILWPIRLESGFISRERDRAAEGAEEQEVLLPVGHAELILVVDDESTILEITRQTLAAFGYRVLTPADGTEGEKAVQSITTYSSKHLLREPNFCPFDLDDIQSNLCALDFLAGQQDSRRRDAEQLYVSTHLRNASRCAGGIP